MVRANRIFDTLLRSYFRDSEFGQNGNTFLEFRFEDLKQTDGFQCEMLKGNVYYKDHNEKLKCSKSLIVKTLSDSDSHLNITIDVSFVNELLVYNTILPFFYDLNHSLSKLFPKFYYGKITFGDAIYGIQILEDLSEEDFRMTNSKTILDIQHLLLMVKKLGEFHAHSYQAKKIHSEKFFQIAENLTETNQLLNFEKTTLTLLLEHYLECLTTHEKYRDKVEVIRNIIKVPLDFVEKVFLTKKEPTAVICHGDFLRNNVLFKYDSENNPVDIKFVDLATVRYCSPVIDLGLVLYMHSDQEIRDQYWDQLIDIYYDALKNTSPDNDLVPTKSEILAEFKITILQPFLIVLFWLPMMITMEEYSGPDWYAKYFAPEHEEYKHLGFAAPVDVQQIAQLNMLNPSKRGLVLNVLTDILNRGFI